MANPFRKTAFYVLLGFLGIALAGLFLTSGWINPSSPPSTIELRKSPRIDQSQLTTVQSLIAIAMTPTERAFANDALRLADQEVDLAFASTLRDLVANPIPLTPEARQLQSRVRDALARVNADQEQIDRISALADSAKPGDGIEQQSQLAHSRLILDQDELDDARREMMQDEGNALSTIQRLMAEHEKSPEHIRTHGQQIAAPIEETSTITQPEAGSLIEHLRNWSDTRSKHKMIFQARQDTLSRLDGLSKLHHSLQEELKLESATSEANQKGKGINSNRVVNGKVWVDLDKRMEADRKLGEVYGRWDAVLQDRAAVSLHLAIQSAFWIVLVLLIMLATDHLINYLHFGLTQEASQLLTLRSIMHYSLRALGLLLIAFVIFGRPSQLATVLGLVGAGLTVALKDFIVGFFGWFMLMGRNGMRRGDWVEINGVQGKVIQVGLLHTVILETGNWTDAGQPTGRKVTFVNSFPIEGHYFNFTTAGQWLWDEVQVELRSDVNPYPIVEAIQMVVNEETESNVKMAEEEWKSVTATSGMHPLSAEPSISVRPMASGVNLVVRYITRADERESIRSRLYNAISNLLIAKNALVSAKKTKE